MNRGHEAPGVIIGFIVFGIFSIGLVAAGVLMRKEIAKNIQAWQTCDRIKLFIATENFDKLFSYIATGRVNIRIHRDVTGEMWFGVG